MGAGFYSQCTNNSGAPFNGTTLNEQCMYHVGDLASLPTGNSSFYIEMKDSGSCFFKAGFFIEGFALQGTAQGEYNFLVGLGSSTAYLSESSP